jgi:hypothetical protein
MVNVYLDMETCMLGHVNSFQRLVNVPHGMDTLQFSQDMVSVQGHGKCSPGYGKRMCGHDTAVRDISADIVHVS